MDEVTVTVAGIEKPLYGYRIVATNGRTYRTTGSPHMIANMYQKEPGGKLTRKYPIPPSHVRPGSVLTLTFNRAGLVSAWQSWSIKCDSCSGQLEPLKRQPERIRLCDECSVRYGGPEGYERYRESLPIW